MWAASEESVREQESQCKVFAADGGKEMMRWLMAAALTCSDRGFTLHEHELGQATARFSAFLGPPLEVYAARCSHYLLSSSEDRHRTMFDAVVVGRGPLGVATALSLLSKHTNMKALLLLSL